MFAEVIGPLLYCACHILGGMQIGTNIYGVDLGAAWMYQSQKHGTMDDDTMRAYAGATVAQYGNWSTGVYAADIFWPDGKKGGHLPIEYGAYQDYKIGAGFSVRAYASKQNAMMSIRWTL